MNISQYRKRFYNLMESELGNVKPLLAEEECLRPQEPELFVEIKKNLIKNNAGFTVEEGATSCDGKHGEFILSKGDDKIKVNTFFDKDIQKSMANIYHNVCGKPQQSPNHPMNQMMSVLKDYYNENVASCLGEGVEPNPYLI